MYKLNPFGKCCALTHRTKSLTDFTRCIFSITRTWPEKFNRHLRENVEKYWKEKLHDMDISVNNQARSIVDVISCISIAEIGQSNLTEKPHCRHT